ALIGEATRDVRLDRSQDGSRRVSLPASTIFEPFRHAVGELARALSKEVALTIDGGDFHVDKRVLDQLRAPIMHMVRNCVDHGVEDPETRVSMGKERAGNLVLAARWRDSALAIEVADDGAGIDVAKVKAAAVERGLLGPAAAARMSEHEALWLIFQSGVSTRQKVTRLSGRGVGLDVVREHVERLQGTIDVKSMAGQGTTFTLRVPLGASAC